MLFQPLKAQDSLITTNLPFPLCRAFDYWQERAHKRGGAEPVFNPLPSSDNPAERVKSVTRKQKAVFNYNDNTWMKRKDY